MRVYIAGPMSGLPDHNYPAFHAAAAAWRAAGWTVANPAEHFGGDQTRTYREYVEADVGVLKGCDAIAMLPGWGNGHSGAIWEREIAAQLLGVPVYDAEAPQPLSKRLDEPIANRVRDWPDTPLARGGRYNTLGRWTRPEDECCSVCCRSFSASVWDGECVACEPRED